MVTRKRGHVIRNRMRRTRRTRRKPKPKSSHHFDSGYFSNGYGKITLKTLAPHMKEIKAKRLPIGQFSDVLHHPVWNKGMVPWALKAKMALGESLSLFEKREVDRIRNASLVYPIWVYTDHSGRMQVIDGMHRLVKASLEGHRTINAREISYAHLLSLMRDDA